MKDFEVYNGENMENALKINDYRKTLSFCKYIQNEMKNMGVNYYLVSLSLKFHKDLSFCYGDIYKMIMSFCNR